MNKVITVKNLQKNYGTKKAVNDITFSLSDGEVLGFLGPNGAGKSTTINILSTILKADKGEINVLGYELTTEANLIKKEIGVVPQDLAIYEELTTEKNVSFFASLYGLSGSKLQNQVKEALELVGLYDKRKDKPKTFSGGMKRRLNIACAIAHKPKVIIMDEPTVGIDPQSRNHILESIKILKRRGAAVIYSTHYMEEVEAIADRIVIMNEGKIIAEGTAEELKQKVNDEITYSFRIIDIEKIDAKELKMIGGVNKVRITDDEVQLMSLKSIDNLNEIVSFFLKRNCKIENMNSKEASLETIFLELTGRNLRD